MSYITLLVIGKNQKIKIELNHKNLGIGIGMDIPIDIVIDINYVKLVNFKLDGVIPIVFTVSDNSLWSANVSLSKLIQIYKSIGKQLPECLQFDQKTMNYINFINAADLVGDANIDVIFNCERFLASL